MDLNLIAIANQRCENQHLFDLDTFAAHSLKTRTGRTIAFACLAQISELRHATSDLMSLARDLAKTKLVQLG